MTNPKRNEAFQKSIDEHPFQYMHIDTDDVLENLQGRYPCSHCGKSRKYFCYTCYVPIAELQGKLPVVKLPLKLDIIKHKNEIDGKSTAAHAAVLASDEVTVYTYPDIPSYDNEKVVLIYPSYEAVTVDQLFNNNENLCELRNEAVDLPNGFHKTTLLTKKQEYSNSNLPVKRFLQLPIEKALFIDSTWNQSKSIYKDGRINKLPCVVLQNRMSQFWRHQRGSPRWYLSTVEAIHQFLVEIHLNMWGLHSDYRGIKNCFTEINLFHIQNLISDDNSDAYNGQYDNLLFFFKYMYKLIHAYYDHEMLYAYKRRLL